VFVHRFSRLISPAAVLSIAMLAFLVSSPRAQEPDAAALFKKSCASCHDGSGATRAPAPEALKARSPEAIVDALTGGAMRYQGLSLGGAERRALAEYLTGKKIGGDLTGVGPARCRANTPMKDPATTPLWNGWGPTIENNHFQPTQQAGLTADQVPHLTLKWAFGFPDTTASWGQPTIAGGRLFVGSQNGTVYALDAKSGCVYWTFTAQGGVRASISIGRRSGPGSPGGTAASATYGAYFSDQKGFAYALDAANGKLIWSKKVDDHPLIRLTGAPALYQGRLYVPTSSYEEVGKGADYECCTFRGAVVAMDEMTGSILWRAYTIVDEPKPMGKNKDGIESYGPAGGAIWSAPTIDVKRGAIYVGGGNTYAGSASQPGTDGVDAFDLKTGRLLWMKQLHTGDIFGCRNGEPNCGDRQGPDFDFGAGPTIAHLPNGRDLIVIGQKSGIAWALDPDNKGEIVWQYQAGRGGALGGIEWGTSLDGDLAYIPVADAQSPTPGGLHAVKLATGERVWFTPPPTPLKCGAPGRGCSAAQSAAITVIPGVVFSGSFDGGIRAYSTKDGSVIWDFDTNREFLTLNGVSAHGASINGPAPVVAGGMVYVGSGDYRSRTGNVLLAFAVQ
jgi:polyvinyl alcohol dehydrogenase (cytochrome)